MDSKSTLTRPPLFPPVVYATDRSKAVVLMRILVCVALWLLPRAFRVESCLAFCCRVFQSRILFGYSIFFFFFIFCVSKKDKFNKSLVILP